MAMRLSLLIKVILKVYLLKGEGMDYIVILKK